jgi:hypothetical protein
MAGLRVSVVGRILGALLVSVCLAACGQGGPTASDAVGNYVYALAEGNYAGACALLSPATRDALERSHGGHASCEKLVQECLPNQVTKSSHDQSQLLFANVQLTHVPGGMQASVSGRAAASATKEVAVDQVRGSVGDDLAGGGDQPVQAWTPASRGRPASPGRLWPPDGVIGTPGGLRATTRVRRPSRPAAAEQARGPF